MSEEREHAELGGSTAHRWANCTGSVFLQRDMPKKPAGKAADEGTWAHAYCERVLTDFLDEKKNGGISSFPKTEGEKYEITEAVEGWVNTIWEKALEGFLTGKDCGIETKITLDEGLQMFGYIDFWCSYTDDHAKRVGVCADFKYGYHPVVADDNYQLAFYACALRAEEIKKGKDLDSVKGIIYQPRARDKNVYSEAVFSGKELDKYEKKFFKAAKEIYVDKKPTFKVGDWCQFCPAQAKCEVYLKELSDSTTLKLIDPENTPLPVLKDIPDEVLKNIILNEDKIIDFVKACKAHVINRAQNGKNIEGVKCVEGATRRKWRDDINLIQDYLNALGLTPCEYTDTKLLNLTSVEKAIIRKKGKDMAKECMDALTTRTQPSLTLVPDSDPRPAITTSIDLLVSADMEKE